MHITEDRYDLLKSASVSLVASGTATLEAALCGRPFCVVYKTGWITYQIAKRLINLKNVGLVNIVAGETIVPEFLQVEMNSENLAAFCREHLSPTMRFGNHDAETEIGERSARQTGRSRTRGRADCAGVSAMKFLYRCLTYVYVLPLSIAVMIARLFGNRTQIERLGLGLAAIKCDRPSSGWWHHPLVKSPLRSS